MILDLKSRMSNFTTRFDQFIALGREQMRKERNNHLAGLTEDRLTQRAHLQSIEKIKQDQIQLEAALEAEKAEVKEIEESIQDYSSKRAVIRDLKGDLEERLRDIQGAMSRKRQVIAQECQAISAQNAKNRPELGIWESQLGLQIETAGIDLLQFKFTKIEDRNPQESYYFVIDLATSTYDMRECQPPLPCINTLLAELNATRDFGKFLKQMRAGFKKLVA